MSGTIGTPAPSVPANTLLLDRTVWDLCKDTSGNIAMASPPYATTQDVASAVRTFRGEVWYDTTLGIPYFQSILGKFPSLGFVKAQIVTAAQTVPGVASAVAYLTGFTGRKLSGQVQIQTTTASGGITGDGLLVADFTSDFSRDFS